MAGVGLSAFGSRRWARTTTSLRDALLTATIDAHGGPPPAARVDFRELEGLPVPVQRFFRAVLTDGQPMVASVDIDFTGRLNLSTTGDRWKPFTARQRIVARPAGFVWDARVVPFPGVDLRVVDAYVAGEAVLDVALLGVVPLARSRGTGAMAEAELIRWIAELAWLPTALLPSQGVSWEGLDAESANATFVDGPLTVTLRFRFAAAGPIESVHADARAATVGGRLTLTPWEGRWSDHRTCQGMQVPMQGEAAWVEAGGRRPYFEGRVASIRHVFATQLQAKAPIR